VKLMERSERFDASLTPDGRYRLLVEAVTDYAIYMLDPDGVHLRHDSVRAETVRTIAPAGFLVGRSVNGLAEAEGAGQGEGRGVLEMRTADLHHVHVCLAFLRQGIAQLFNAGRAQHVDAGFRFGKHI
jgi:hypothetical protein